MLKITYRLNPKIEARRLAIRDGLLSVFFGLVGGAGLFGLVLLLVKGLEAFCVSWGWL